MKTKEFLEKYMNNEQRDEFNSLDVNYDIEIVGVSGTVGKTSVIEIVYQYLKFIGRETFLVATSGIKCPSNEVANYPCTSAPTKEVLCNFLIDAYRDRCEYFLIETTAESTSVGVYDDLDFEVVGITNLLKNIVRSFSSDEEYFNKKLRLFRDNNVGIIVCNEQCREHIVVALEQRKNKEKEEGLIFYNKNRILKTTNENGYLSFCIDNEWFSTSLLSTVNIDNILCALGIIQSLKLYDLFIFKQFCNRIVIPGRLESFTLFGRLIIIDSGYNGLNGIRAYFDESGFMKTHILLSTYFFDNERDTEQITKLYRQQKAIYFSDKADTLVLAPTSATKNNKIPDEKIAIFQMRNILKPNTYTIAENRIEGLKLIWNTSKSGDRIFITGMGSEVYAKAEKDGQEQYVGDKEVIIAIAQESMRSE